MSFMPISFVSRSVTFFPPPTPFIHSFFRTRLVWLGLDWIGLDCFGSVRLGFVFLVFFFPSRAPSFLGQFLVIASVFCDFDGRISSSHTQCIQTKVASWKLVLSHCLSACINNLEMM
jgi:hypothetical protein